MLKKIRESAVWHYGCSAAMLVFALLAYRSEWHLTAGALLIVGVLDSLHTIIEHCRGKIE